MPGYNGSPGPESAIPGLVRAAVIRFASVVPASQHCVTSSVFRTWRLLHAYPMENGRFAMRSNVAVLAVVSLGFTLAGCSVKVDSGRNPEQTKTVNIDRPKAEMVEVTVTMHAGELEMSGGATKLMEGRFTYSGGNEGPEVRFDDSSFRGRLDITNRSRTTTMGPDSKNLWEVKLANDVRMDLNVTLGAGQSHLNLGDLTLRSAKVQLGAGQVEMDLRGPKKSSCDVEIRGGVGEATVWVPNDVGVVAEAKGGIGEVSVRGLTRDGKRWVNEKYNKSPITIRLDVKGGIGQINIRAE